MSNLYSIIIGLFALSGLLLSIWSWRNISKAKKSTKWPKVEGRITSATSSSETEDMKPQVEYCYTVNAQNYTGTLSLPSGDVHLSDYAKVHAEKYPIDSSVTVYYDPESPENSTLEPGVRDDDWLIFWLCVGALGTGTAYLLFNI